MTSTKSEHAASHTWDGERCSVCGVGLHGTASIMVCDPDRMAKGLAKVNGEDLDNDGTPFPMKVRTTDRNGDPVVITVSVLAVERDVNDDPVVVLGASRDRMDRDTGWSNPEGADHIHLGIAAGSLGYGAESRSAAFVGFRR